MPSRQRRMGAGSEPLTSDGGARAAGEVHRRLFDGELEIRARPARRDSPWFPVPSRHAAPRGRARCHPRPGPARIAGATSHGSTSMQTIRLMNHSSIRKIATHAPRLMNAVRDDARNPASSGSRAPPAGARGGKRYASGSAGSAACGACCTGCHATCSATMGNRRGIQQLATPGAQCNACHDRWNRRGPCHAPDGGGRRLAVAGMVMLHVVHVVHVVHGPCGSAASVMLRRMRAASRRRASITRTLA